MRQALLQARCRTLALASACADALGPALLVPYAETLNPPRWELGHIAWFQDHWVSRNRQRTRGVACDPDHIRAPSQLPEADAWYDSSRVAHRTRWELPLPDQRATLAYLGDSLARTLRCLDELGEDASAADLYCYRLAAAHEEMHAEAGAYMARALGMATHVKRAAAALPTHASVLQVPGQRFRLGSDGAGFAFDNELGAHDVALAAFEIDAQPVSWRRFQIFIDAGGYGQPHWWSEAGWRWREQARTGPPALDGDAETALHLSAHEAEAWCRWAGRRLPTEAEWECAALTAPGFAWGTAWEWTATSFAPYPEFVPHPYRDYSAPWFGTRRVLRGACAETAPILAHPRYRNFFEPHRCDIFSGFRTCAVSAGSAGGH